MTNLELTDDDAKLYLDIKKHEDLFRAIIESNILGLKRGDATLSFNHDGELMHIEVRTMAYKKTKK